VFIIINAPYFLSLRIEKNKTGLGKIESNRGNWTILREGLKYVDFK